jgi:hypothetical protein
MRAASKKMAIKHPMAFVGQSPNHSYVRRSFGVRCPIAPADLSFQTHDLTVAPDPHQR